MIMKTVTVQIDNSDDALTQRDWSCFIARLNETVTGCIQSLDLHFSGASLPNVICQNYCMVFKLDAERLPSLRHALYALADEFGQYAVSLTIGDTEYAVPGWGHR